MKKIKRFGVYQTSKIIGIIYFCIFAITMIPLGLFSGLFGGMGDMGMGMGGFGAMFFFIAPFLYGFFAFIGTAIACAIYNFIADKVGGIELEIETTDEVMGDRDMV